MDAIRRRLVATAAAFVPIGAWWPFPLLAAAWPHKPVTLVVPFSAGGPADGLARFIATELGRRLGQTVVVENVPGAGASIGMSRVARAEPDGYTLGYATTASHITAPFLYRKLPYDPVKDFTPVSLAAEHVNVLVTASASPLRSVPQLIEFARQHPGRLTFGSAGIGATNHLSVELLMKMTGTRMRHVPYKGSGPALIDVVAGTIDFMFDVPLTCMPLVNAGRLRALGTTLADKSRHRSVPDLPAIAEFVPGYEVVGWVGLVGPAGMPGEAVSRLAAALHALMTDPATVERLATQGFDAMADGPAPMAARIARDRGLWGELIASTGIRLE